MARAGLRFGRNFGRLRRNGAKKLAPRHSSAEKSQNLNGQALSGIKMGKGCLLEREAGTG
jgi:hypothetical protein